MAENTKIEWADHTFNSWIGCTKVSPGCDHCYAKAQWEDRRHRVVWGPGQARSRTKTWGDPVKWNAQHEAFYAQHGRRQRVFCASLADVFDNEVPPEWRHDLFNLIVATPHLDWLLLTKRPQNIVRMVLDHGCVAGNGMRYLPGNVWLGATAEDQNRADSNVPALLNAKEQTGAKIAFLSMEPLLGPVDLTYVDDGTAHRDVPREEWGSVDDDDSPPGLWWNVLTGERTIMHGGANGDWSRTDASVDWVIVGGESGPGARPLHPDWARSLRDQCQAAGVPFFFKQWGEWLGARQDGSYEHSPVELNASDASVRVGRKAAGRLLDGVAHDEVPA